MDGAWVPITGGGSGDGITQAEADTRYVNIPGDTMTGRLNIDNPAAEQLRLIHATTPYVSWYTPDATRVGYIQGRASSQTDPGLRIFADPGYPLMLGAAGSENFRLRTPTSGEIATFAGSPSAYVYFRDGTPGGGTGRCYVGFDTTWGARLTALTGDALLHAAAGEVRVHAGGDVIFFAGGAQVGLWDGGTFCVQKTAADIGLTGCHLNDSSVAATNNTTNWALGIFNKVGAGVGSGHDYLHFRTNNNTIGTIQRNGTQSAVSYNTTSDYRLKHDRGLITNARERIKVLKPRRVVWKDDPEQAEVDGFFAHEVAEVVPDAVTGEKDAVAEKDDDAAGHKAGEIIPQQMDNSKLIPLLVAAVQELTTEVEALRAEVAELRGAA